MLFVTGRSQSDENADDEDQTDSNNKKNSQTDLTQRGRADFRSAAKETGKLEKTTTGTKRKALNSRSGKDYEIFISQNFSEIKTKVFIYSREFK